MVGAGRTELAKTLFGLTPADEGTILLRGEPVSIHQLLRKRSSLASGICRKIGGGTASFWRWRSAPTQRSLHLISWLASAFLIFKQEREIAADYAQRLAVKTPSLFAPVTTHSGGNQQKVALSRWLATKPSLLILDEPTQGVDVGAKAEIHTLMGELAAQGLAI